MRMLPFRDVVSPKTGLRGRTDQEQPLVDGEGRVVDLDNADAYVTPTLRDEQLRLVESNDDPESGP